MKNRDEATGLNPNLQAQRKKRTGMWISLTNEGFHLEKASCTKPGAGLLFYDAMQNNLNG
jgi:hypothetical protein